MIERTDRQPQPQSLCLLRLGTTYGAAIGAQPQFLKPIGSGSHDWKIGAAAGAVSGQSQAGAGFAAAQPQAGAGFAAAQPQAGAGFAAAQPQAGSAWQLSATAVAGQSHVFAAAAVDIQPQAGAAARAQVFACAVFVRPQTGAAHRPRAFDGARSRQAVDAQADSAALTTVFPSPDAVHGGENSLSGGLQALSKLGLNA